MSEKKNIDNLFKEAFKNHEASPSPQVWENIQARLKEEKSERKVIPLWIRLGGVAALLALILSVGNMVFDPFGVPDGPSIVTKDNTEQVKPDADATRSSNAINNTDIDNTQVVSTDSNNTDTNVVLGDRTSDSSDRSSATTDEVVKPKTKSNTVTQKSSETVIASEVKEKTTLPSVTDTKSDIGNQIKDTTIEVPTKTEEAIAVETPKEVIENEVDPTDTRPSILDAIAEQEVLVGKANGEELDYRWKVTPNLAPVYYSSIGSGSSIDPEFANNPQSGDVNMSYGVQVSYALNNRLSIRTGLNNVDLSYSTSDLVIATGPAARGLKGVDYGSKEVVVTAVSKNSLRNGSSADGYHELNLKSTAGDARLVQSINYFEVPMELQYAVLDKKIGLNIIGGVSTMFLGNNEIWAKANNFSSIIGEANNLSSVSFSTNVGLGIDYKLTPRFVFNLEPMFKYQLNPYSDSSVDFRPYYLGVYSGLSFKF